MSEDSQAERARRRRTIAIRFAVAAVVIGVLALATLPLISFFGDPKKVEQLITNAGAWGPLVFILIQIGQVFAAPVPGQVTGFVGGFLFGAGLGTLYSTIGGVIGCTLVFLLSRRLGRPFVERFVRKKTLDRFDYLSDSGGQLVLLIIFLVPIFPDDLICYIAGLTRIPISRLVLITLIGRIPGYAVFSLTGAGAAQSNLTLVTIVAVTIAVTAGLAFWQRHRIERFLKRLSATDRDGAGSA
jgi:uncharacterized membrane protein YdjX (TVP38/TMEM64 family)